MKPMLAEDYDEGKIVFPVVAQPKIDGVRALNLTGKLTGRSLKAFGNRHVTDMFSYSVLAGLDGEMAAEKETHPALCRLTTSALSTHEGSPFVLWWLFDYVTPNTSRLPYVERYKALQRRINYLKDTSALAAVNRLHIVPMYDVNNLAELNYLDDLWLDMGFEGTIIRNPNSGYKYGRSTVREGGLLRIKRFIEEEAVVIAIEEGQSNQNEATTNALGQTERSTHQANMVPNGMVGAMRCTVVKDVVHQGATLMRKGQEITVAAGSMPHDDRVRYFQNQHLLVGQTIKFKTFPKGVKDKPRFPTFQSIRMEEDQ